MASIKRGGLRTVPEAAKILRLAPSTVYRLIIRGTIRGVKIGANVRVTEEEIDRLRQGEAT